MIKLFSEKVSPTFTSSNHNILTVESFEEVFFDVFEFEINGTKYIAEKRSEYKGNPVVTIPIVESGVEKEMPFVLMKGEFEVLFSKEGSEFVVEDVEDDVLSYIEDEMSNEALLENKESILQDIHNARRLSEEYAERVKLQKIEEATKTIEEKEQGIKDFFANAKSDLLDDFNNFIVENRSDLEAYNEQKSSELEKYLTTRIEDNFSKFFNNNNKRIEDLTSTLSEKVNGLVSNVVDERVNPALYDVISKNKDGLVAITESINNTLSETEQRVLESVKSEIEKNKDYVSGVERTIVEQHVELNDKIKKGVDKALGRVGNIKTAVLVLKEELEHRVDNAGEEIKELCEDTIKGLKGDIEDRVQITIDKNKEFISEAKKDIDNSNKLLDESVKVSVDRTIGKIESVSESVNSLEDKLVGEIKQTNKKIEVVSAKSQQRVDTINEDVAAVKKKLSSEIVDKTKNIKGAVAKTVSRLEEKVQNELAENKQYVSDVEKTLVQQNVELNNAVNSGVTKTLKKVESIESSVDVLREDINSSSKSISVLEEKVLDEINTIDKGIRKYYDTKIDTVKNDLEELTEDQKKYFVNLISESKQSLLKQVNKDKDKFRESLLNEAKTFNLKFSREGDVDKVGDDTREFDPEAAVGEFERDQSKLKSELEKAIGDRFTNEISSLKKLIEFSSSGGSVAKQFADGGVMNGNLTVVGTISAREYLGIPSTDISGDYLPLSGGTINGDVTITGTLSTTLLEALSANITVLDIKQYELSGFNVTGDVLIDGNTSTTGLLSTACGDSSEWCSTYTTVSANSAIWSDHFDSSEIASASGNWDSTYTTVNTESADWESTYTTVLGNSAFWDGNFCDEIVYMSELSSCETGVISVSAELAMNDNPISQLHYIDFDLVHNVAPQEGRLSWNEADGTLDLGLKGDGGVNLQIGMEQVVRVKASEEITNGQVLYIDGAVGINPTVSIASNDIQLEAHSVIGVATEDIANNQLGYMTVQGLVRGIDTSNIPTGDIAYLGLNGSLSATPPDSPDHEVRVGYCVISNATTGILYTNIDLGEHLNDIHDVLLTSPQANDTLLYNSVSGLWENQTTNNWESTYTTVQGNSASWGEATSIVGNLSSYSNITTETASTINVASTDGIILVDASAGAAVINLPGAVGSNGRRITIKKIDITNNTATLSANTNIDGIDTFTINKKYDAVEVMSDNTQWWII